MKQKLFSTLLVFILCGPTYARSISFKAGGGTDIDMSSICSSNTLVAVSCASKNRSDSSQGLIVLEGGDSIGLQVRGQGLKLIRCLDSSGLAKDSIFMNSVGSILNMKSGTYFELSKASICDGKTLIECDSDSNNLLDTSSITNIYLGPNNKAAINISDSSNDLFSCAGGDKTNKLAERPKSKGKRGKRIEQAAAEEASYYDGGNPQ